MTGEFLKTGVLAFLAIVLSAAVFLLSGKTVPPDTDSVGVGQLFYPSLKDPAEITSLEVRVFNQSTTKADNFKVEETPDGKWVIPSHHNYPADAKEQLGKTVRSFMDLKMDAFVSKAVKDHEIYGVIDPDDPDTKQIGGRGRKITFRSKDGKIAAEYIIGKRVEGQEDQYYVRIPKQNHIYLVKFKPELSTQFGDWIDKDLLDVAALDIERILISNYSIDESKFPKLQPIFHEQFTLTRKHDDHGVPQELLLDGLKPGEEMNKTNAAELAESLAQLKIIGVRYAKDFDQTPQISMGADGNLVAKLPDLQDLGFFVTQDHRVYCNEGEVLLVTKDHIAYSLRFGELAGGEGEALTAGVDPAGEAASAKSVDKTKAENRYLWISAQFVGEKSPDGIKSPDEKKAAELQARFAQFFYVISDDMVGKVRRKREELTQAKTSAAPAPTPGSRNPIPAGPPNGPEGNTPPDQAPIPARPPTNTPPNPPANTPGAALPPTVPTPTQPVPALPPAPTPPSGPAPVPAPGPAAAPAVPAPN